MARLRELGRGSVGEGAAWALLAGLAAVAMVFAGWAIANRLRYPCELEWMEGGVLDHVRVVLSGAQLYREPSLEFTPYLYTPLYYYAVALPSALFGPSFLVARVVSCLAAGAVLALLHALVRRETGDRLVAFVTVGLFAASYEATGRWWDVARPDSLALALWLGGLWVARSASGDVAQSGSGAHTSGAQRPVLRGVLAGLLLFGAFFAKQTYLVLALPSILWALAWSRRRGVALAATYVALVGGAVAWLSLRTDGWFACYVFQVPGRHPLLWGEWGRVLRDALWSPSGGLVLWSLFSLLGPPRAWLGKPRWSYFALLGATTSAAAYSGLLHDGGYVNVLLPAYACFALLTGLGLAWVRASEVRTTEARALRLFACVSVLTQLFALGWDPRRAVPTSQDEQGCQQMLAALRQAPEPLLVLTSGFLGHLAGHPELHAHAMALADVLRGRPADADDPLVAAVVEALGERRFAAIVVGPGTHMLPNAIRDAIADHYRLELRLFEGTYAQAAKPRTGVAWRPEELWTTRPTVPALPRKRGRTPKVR